MDAILKFEKITNVQSGTSKAGKEWEKAELLVSQQDGNFTNQFVIEAWGGDVPLAKKLIVGEEFKTKITITSREYQGRYYTTAKLFGIKSVNAKSEVKSDWKNEAPSGGKPFDIAENDIDNMPF
jgi:hypothetical protein